MKEIPVNIVSDEETNENINIEQAITKEHWLKALWTIAIIWAIVIWVIYVIMHSLPKTTLEDIRLHNLNQARLESQIHSGQILKLTKSLEEETKKYNNAKLCVRLNSMKWLANDCEWLISNK